MIRLLLVGLFSFNLVALDLAPTKKVIEFKDHYLSFISNQEILAILSTSNFIGFYDREMVLDLLEFKFNQNRTDLIKLNLRQLQALLLAELFDWQIIFLADFDYTGKSLFLSPAEFEYYIYYLSNYSSAYLDRYDPNYFCDLILEQICTYLPERLDLGNDFILFKVPALDGETKDKKDAFLNASLKRFSAWQKLDLAARSAQIWEHEIQLSLNIIKALAPSLYDLIYQNPANYFVHISDTQTDAAISLSHDRVLPKFELSDLFFMLPVAQQTFVLAHELAHYLNLDIVSQSNANYKHIKSEVTTEEEVNEQRQTEIAHLFGNAYLRIQETEADRLAVLDFGASVDAGIAWLKYYIEQGSSYQGRTFDSTHPKDEQRVIYLEQLKRDLALGNIKVRAPLEIDWLAIAKQYQAKFA